MKSIIIAGAGLHGQALSKYLRSDSRYQVVGFTETDPELIGTQICGRPVLGMDQELDEISEDNDFDSVAVGIGDQKTASIKPRLDLFGKLKEQGHDVLTYIHPDASVHESADVGEGTVIYPNSMVGPDASLGTVSMLYGGVVVEHHVSIESNAYFGPGAVLSGEVVFGQSVFVGSNATIFPRVTLEDHCVVGAGAVVKDSQPADTTIV
ncbi:MAG: NeuD/PglB/VioB family sugar acetyltransferase [bacterium]